MIINERSNTIDPFRGLKKRKISRDQLIPPNCITDDLGDCYTIPTRGRSRYIYMSGKKCAYNYSKHRLEMYSKDNQVINSASLSPRDFMDNPEYWVRKLFRLG